MNNRIPTSRDYKLWWLLFQTRHILLLASNSELNRYGISNIQAATLFVIQAIGDKATPAEISRWLLREPHTVSALLGRMKRQGLVRLVKDLDKKNLIRVTLTEKGWQAYHLSAQRGSIHRIMSCLSAEECDQLWQILEKLRKKGLKDIGIDRKLSFPQA